MRRGPAGGYFNGRPDADTIETAIHTYLQTIDFDPEDVTLIASALWVELVHKAALRRDDEARSVIEGLRGRIIALDVTATFPEIHRLEKASREAIIMLADRTSTSPMAQDDTPEHRRFVTVWRDAKAIELSAIDRGDPEVAALAARHVCALWHDRVWLNREAQPCDKPRVDGAPLAVAGSGRIERA